MDISSRKLSQALDMLPEPETYRHDKCRIAIQDEIMSGHFFQKNMDISKHSIQVIEIEFEKKHMSHGLDWVVTSHEIVKFIPESNFC